MPDKRTHCRRRFDEDKEEYVKKCRNCLAEQPLGNFLVYGKERRLHALCNPCRRAHNREYMRRFYQRDPESHRRRVREARAKDPEAANERARQWRARNREHCIEYYRAYNEENREARREYDRQKRAARTPEERRAYNERFRQYMTEYATRRRALRRAATLHPFKRADIIKRDGKVCYLCGKRLSDSEVTLDHVIALIRGGAHAPENLRVACKPCNSAKGAKLLADFLAGR